MPTPTVASVKGSSVRAIGEDILLTNMYFGEEKTAGGIIMTSQDGKVDGIKPRWGQVYSIGPNYKHTDQVHIGDWVLMEHGRWSRGMLIEDEEGIEWVLRKADPEAMLVVSEEEPPEVAEWVQLHQDVVKRLADVRDSRKHREPGERHIIVRKEGKKID